MHIQFQIFCCLIFRCFMQKKNKTLLLLCAVSIMHEDCCSLCFDWLLGNGKVAAQECPLQPDSHTPKKFQCTGESKHNTQTWNTPGISINSCLKAEGGLNVHCSEKDIPWINCICFSPFHFARFALLSAVSIYRQQDKHCLFFMYKLLRLCCGPDHLIKGDDSSRSNLLCGKKKKPWIALLQ